ncbi:hypothetical protein H3S87_07300 [Bifidobacterium sp. W8108]|uniref:hypothetical protein n=1 Tax=unclassified Bifidobacterium TaxID=2608897 RepID=UPI0018DEB92B|nr:MULTISPECIES: hypothetical protein [unclassified Bifidobacterium]MBH9979450.1 hypothetical protein [Bifidobacterium sp. W8108]MBI0174152.1 hypothetical protein [Bifidobacterium sp. M0307]
MSKDKEERITKTVTDTGEPSQGRTPDKDDVATGKESNRPKWLVPAASAAVVVVLIAAGVVCLRVVSNREHTQAVERCSVAVARLEKPAGGAAARTARYREAAAVSSDQVKDAETVVAMARAVKNAGGIKPQPVRCDASMTTGELKAAADKAEDLNGRNDKLDKAAKAVLASRDAKDLDDARAALGAKKEEASRLLGDSDGKVADNTTREALQNAIGQAGQTKGDKAQAWRDAVGPLQTAIDQVNASMQAKAQADQQAAEQAAQAAAQAAAQPVQQAAPSYGGGYTPSYRPSYGQGGGGGGWSAPAPAAPAPAAPQGGGSGKGNWRDRLNRPDNTMHGCRPDGGCGIG